MRNQWLDEELKKIETSENQFLLSEVRKYSCDPAGFLLRLNQLISTPLLIVLNCRLQMLQNQIFIL